MLGLREQGREREGGIRGVVIALEGGVIADPLPFDVRSP